MKAVGEWVIVEPITNNQLQKEQLSKSGFLIPDSKKAEGQPYIGHVRFIGPDVEDPEYSIGDKVLFHEPQPSGFKVDDIGYFALKDEQIVGRVTE